MQIVGFNFTKISAEKFSGFKGKAQPASTALKFLSIEKEKIALLKNLEGVKATFRYSLLYSSNPPKNIETDPEPKQEDKLGELIFEGTIIIATTPEQSKEIFKAWKKKEIPSNIKLSLFNLILRKCSPKAVQLEDEISLPIHLPFPQISPQNLQSEKNS